MTCLPISRNKTSTSEKLTGLAKGAVDFISKPFQIEELKEKINSLIIMQEALKETNLCEFREKINQALADPSGQKKILCF